jgi:hypothetical protein
MTTPYEPEFTRNEGLLVGLAALPVFLGFLYFDERHAEQAVSAFMAVAATAVIRRDLIRRRWFQIFVVVVTMAHLALILASPGYDFTRGEIGLFLLADLLLVLGLAYLAEKVVTALGREAK